MVKPKKTDVTTPAVDPPEDPKLNPPAESSSLFYQPSSFLDEGGHNSEDDCDHDNTSISTYIPEPLP